VYYYCVAAESEAVGKQLCSIFGGVTVEQAVVEAVLDALAPARTEAMVVAAARLAARREETRRQVEMELERARYEADRCGRQYGQVEPENRLVARTLEARWNEAMERVRALEQQCAGLSDEQEGVAAEEQGLLRRLATDLPRLWHHASVPFDLKKRILRTVLKEIVVYVEETSLRVLLHWQGGQHSELSLRKRRPGEHRWTTPVGTVDLIRQLARRMPDKQIAAHLNRLGIETAKGHTWTRIRVGNFRTIHEIPNYSLGEREARGELTVEEAAARLGVSYSTVQRMIQRRQLPARQVCPRGPWVLHTEDVEAFLAQHSAPQPPRRRPSSPHRDQRTLEFPEGAEQPLRAGDQDDVLARPIDRLPCGADAFHRVGHVEQGIRPVDLAILDGEPGHPGPDRPGDVGRHGLGVGGEARLEIGVHREVDGPAQGRQVREDVVAGHRVVRAAGRPGVARAGRRQGGEAVVLEQPGAADVPGVGQDEAASLVEGAKGRAFLGGGAGHGNLGSG
jgi:excisionase family DNA binding protein